MYIYQILKAKLIESLQSAKKTFSSSSEKNVLLQLL